MMLQSRFLNKSGAAFVIGGERAALLSRVRIHTQISTGTLDCICSPLESLDS